MKHVRLSLWEPQPRHRHEMWHVLRSMDEQLAGLPDLSLSFTFGNAEDREGHLGRVSIWDNEATANALARSERALAMRAELQRLSATPPIEMFVPMTSIEGIDPAVHRILRGEVRLAS